MRRELAAIVAVSVCVLQSQALAFHVHAAPEHSTGTRHAHAPAIHHHDADDRHDTDSGPRVETDDSAVGRVITVAVPAGTTAHATAAYAEFAEALPAGRLKIVGETRVVDARSHGPPPSRNSFLRGPPTSALS